jgi:hypothetical protein
MAQNFLPKGLINLFLVLVLATAIYSAKATDLKETNLSLFFQDISPPVPPMPLSFRLQVLLAMLGHSPNLEPSLSPMTLSPKAQIQIHPRKLAVHKACT